jgi:alpha-D-ribose 1-methylphosphonate 5-triphosphate synthase subunit PhnG
MMNGQPKDTPLHQTARGTPRQQWMAILARATRADLEAILASQPLPAFEVLKAPETGSVMVEGRAGGTGNRFNLGEATVTRCVVRVGGNVMGHAYAFGRDKRKAQLAALLDAMLQSESPGTALHDAVVRLSEVQAEHRAAASRKAAATKVEFFTLVRGE